MQKGNTYVVICYAVHDKEIISHDTFFKRTRPWSSLERTQQKRITK